MMLAQMCADSCTIGDGIAILGISAGIVGGMWVIIWGFVK